MPASTDLDASSRAQTGAVVTERAAARLRAAGVHRRATEATRYQPDRTAARPRRTAPATPTTSVTPTPDAVRPSVTPPSPAASPAARGDGLEGVTFYGPNAGAARAAAQSGQPEDSALLRRLAEVPTGTWLGAWSGDVTTTVRQLVADARAAGGVPVLVAYDIPDRDCGGHSSGGADSPAAYARWIQGIAEGIGDAQAVVVVEPDSIAQLCGDPAARFQMLRDAVQVLERNPGTHTYLDAGHSAWVGAAEMAGRLRAAGVDGADGFALNVSNFGTTASNVAYGRQLAAMLGGARFVVDTSRNGNGPGGDWCNPDGRAVGERPTATTGLAGVDAFLWVKTPGESDGACNGGPTAGTFWPEYALGLVRGW